MLARLNALIKEATRAPFQGRAKLSGWWSRRLMQEDRMIYKPTEQGLMIAQFRYHYY